MRLIHWPVALAAVAGAADVAQAEDWRMMPDVGGHDIAFVDAASVVRRPGGHIRFRAQLRLDANPSNADFGYDRIDLRVEGVCRAVGGRDTTVRLQRTYWHGGRRVAEPDWKAEELEEHIIWLADDICRGVIGQRRSATVEAALASGERNASGNPMAEYVSPEADLVGTVVQGFEMSGINLCGSEEGCTDDAPEEFCWLGGNAINVPAPTSAPDWVNGGPRRDAADFAFRGRIRRSMTGRGYGHMGGFGCEVEVTGPVQPTRITQRRPSRAEPPSVSLGRLPETLAAHSVLQAAVSAAAPITIARGSRRWTVDAALPGSTGSGGTGACTTLFQFRGSWLTDGGPAFGWNLVSAITQVGQTVTLTTTGYDESLRFYFNTPAAAARMKVFAERLVGAQLLSVAQAGRRVTLRFAGTGRQHVDYPDAGAAIEAAGLAERLRQREIARVTQYNNSIFATPVDRYVLSFGQDSDTAAVVQAMRNLTSLCRIVQASAP